MSAVFGGTFLLNNNIEKLIIENQNIKVVLNNKIISCNYLLSSVNSTPSELIQTKFKSFISRAILITNKSIKTIHKTENLNKEV